MDKMTNRLVQRINDSGMTIIGNFLKCGLLPPLELVKISRNAFACALDNTDPDLSKKKTILRDIDEIIYHIEHGHPRLMIIK